MSPWLQPHALSVLQASAQASPPVTHDLLTGELHARLLVSPPMHIRMGSGACGATNSERSAAGHG